MVKTLFCSKTCRIGWVAFVCFLTTACSYEVLHYSSGSSPTSRSTSSSQSAIPSTGYHRVKSGESLFSIAFRYGLDYRDVAEYNRISSPYVIYPNQKIRLSVPTKNTQTEPELVAKTSPTRAAKASTPTPTQSAKKAPVTKVTKATNTPQNVASWHWPVDGTVTQGFSNAGVSSKGIDIKGKKGALVKAAADGVVVYSGNGLIGYGNLVIVKHSDVYLSAYAYNESILVKEQQNVKAGDSLAVIGGKGSNKPVLHFEVRRDGQPIDPLKILPKK